MRGMDRGGEECEGGVGEGRSVRGWGRGGCEGVGEGRM